MGAGRKAATTWRTGEAAAGGWEEAEEAASSWMAEVGLADPSGDRDPAAHSSHVWYSRTWWAKREEEVGQQAGRTEAEKRRTGNRAAAETRETTTDETSRVHWALRQAE